MPCDAIRVESVTFGYGSQPVLNALNLTLPRGRITALTGPNGCGKTTLTRLIVGLLRPQAGRILIQGQDIAPLDLCAIGRLAGYVFQNPEHQLFCQTALEEVAYGLRAQGLPQDQAESRSLGALAAFGLEAEAKSYPLHLSGGQKRRLALAAVTALEPPFLILDEPTTGLDAAHQSQLGEILSRLTAETGCGILIVSHQGAFIARYAQEEVAFPHA